MQWKVAGREPQGDGVGPRKGVVSWTGAEVRAKVFVKTKAKTPHFQSRTDGLGSEQRE